MAQKQRGSGTKKYDRQRKSAQNLRYIAEKRHDKSPRRRITAHLLTHANDNVAQAALKRFG